MAIGMAIASLYLLPAMLDQSSVRIDQMHSGDSYYENWFFFARDPNGVVVVGRTEFVRALFWMMLSMIAVGACAAIAAWRSDRAASRRPIVFWAAVLVGATLMTLPLSQPLYGLLSPLQVIQFPWRFNVVVTVAVTALIGIALDGIPRPLRGVRKVAVGVGAVLVAWWLAFTVEPLRATSFNPRPHVSQRAQEWLADNANTPEYHTKWTRVDVHTLIRQLRGNADTIVRAVIVQGVGTLAVRSWKPRHISLALVAGTPTTVEVRQFYYPNWVASVNGSAAPLTLTPAASTGLMRLDVPAGTKTIDIHLEPSAAERSGTAISALSLAACVGAAAFGVMRRRRRALDLRH
jgi:hypothetical protein